MKNFTQSRRDSNIWYKKFNFYYVILLTNDITDRVDISIANYRIEVTGQLEECEQRRDCIDIGCLYKDSPEFDNQLNDLINILDLIQRR